MQHLANVFWSRWRSEYLSELQKRQKWTETKRNFQVGDIVLMRDTDVSRQQWPMGRITKVFPDQSDGLIRSVELHLPKSKSPLKRPIHKLVLLVESSQEVDQSNNE